MRLDIENIYKLINSEYHRGRFMCIDAVETETNYRFQFHDNSSPSARFIWVEISRIGHYNSIEGHWEYRLNYPNHPIHIVTADWLRFPPNAVSMMEDCLNYSL
jgi:hypothetical protein